MAKIDFQYGGWNYYTLQCGMWLWDDMPRNSPKRPPYWNSTAGFNFDHITAVDMSFCTSLRNFIQIGPPSAERMTSCQFSRWWISAILDFRGQIMGSLNSPGTTSCRSSIDTIALNCLVLEKVAFLSASLYFSKRGAYWDRLCRDVVGCHARALWPNGAS